MGSSRKASLGILIAGLVVLAGAVGAWWLTRNDTPAKSPAAIHVGYSTLTPLHCALGEIFRRTDILQRHGYSDVAFTPFAHGKDQHEASATGAIDATFVCEVPAIVHLSRLPGMVLAGSPGSLGDIALVVRQNDSAWNGLADLCGESLAVQEGSSSMLVYEQWLREEKVRKSNSIHVESLFGNGDEAIEAVLSGRARAAILWDPWLSKALQEHPLRVVKSVPFYSEVALFPDHAPVTDPDRYLAALAEALAYGHDHFDQVVTWVAETSGLPAPTVAAVLHKNEFVGQGLRPETRLQAAHADRLKACAEFARRDKLVAPDFTLDQRIQSPQEAP